MHREYQLAGRVSAPLPIPLYSPIHRAPEFTRRGFTGEGKRVRPFPSDISISPFPRDLLRPVFTPMEFLLEQETSGRVRMSDISSTPKSLITRFKAERVSMTPDVPDAPMPRRIESIKV